MRWGIARGKGTIVGTCDDNTEVRVRWDEDRREGRNVKCGKRGDYWLMTAGGCRGRRGEGDESGHEHHGVEQKFGAAGE